VLVWVCLAAGLFAGLFLTADCLSEEKRDGTLGLLFLTELRGIDVVVGKLMATSLRGFYALLAVLPILAVTLLVGGITGTQFWKSSLALIDGLFLSLAAGLLVSALSYDSQKALGATLFLVLMFGLGGPFADALIAMINKRAAVAFWSIASPGYALATAGAWGRSAYWWGILLTQAMTWAMFILACILVPHTWQQGRNTGAANSASWIYKWKHGGAWWRRRQRKLLERMPLAWLAGRDRWQPVIVWTVALLAASSLAALLIAKVPGEFWMVWMYLGGLFTLILYIAGASQACRFFADMRRSGLLELLLVTPLGENQMVAGQWRALRRQFAWPLMVLLGVYITASVLAQFNFQRMTSGAVATATTTTVTTNQYGVVTNQMYSSTTVVAGPGGATAVATNMPPGRRILTAADRRRHVWISAISASAVGVRTIANLLAICWFGMWMGLTSRTANLATGKTLLFVQVIPWFIITFGTTLVLASILFRPFRTSARSNPTDPMLWWPLANAIATTLLALVKDGAFIIWSKQKLAASLRERAAHAAGQGQVPRLASVTPPPPPAAS
jgi:uncharacterized membrane protein YhaH (DUF805 family)